MGDGRVRPDTYSLLPLLLPVPNRLSYHHLQVKPGLDFSPAQCWHQQVRD